MLHKFQKMEDDDMPCVGFLESTLASPQILITFINKTLRTGAELSEKLKIDNREDGFELIDFAGDFSQLIRLIDV